jgi:hypothetical protein
MGPARRPAPAKALVRYSRQETFVLGTRKICPAHSAAIDAYFQQSILGIVIIVSVALTFDRGKVSMIK